MKSPGQKGRQIIDGDMIHIPKEGDWFRMICCDCSLTHDYVFAPSDDDGMYWQIEQNKRATARRRIGETKMNIPDSANEWLAKGERGISSEAIFSYMTGINVVGKYGMGYPYDPSDFRRCHLLLEAVPEFKKRFKEMRLISKEWHTLVDHWDELVELLDIDVPEWRTTGKGNAPKTYDRMQELIR